MAAQRPRSRAARQPDGDVIGRKASDAAPPTNEARVRHVMGLIASGRWQGVDSIAELAVEWEMSEGTLTRVAAEAQRRVAAVDDGDFVRRRLAVAIDELVDEARAMVRKGDPRALSGFAQVGRLFADITGATRAATPTTDGPPVFRVELTTAPPQTACPPSGNSSPPDDGPAPGSPPSSPGS